MSYTYGPSVPNLKLPKVSVAEVLVWGKELQQEAWIRSRSLQEQAVHLASTWQEHLARLVKEVKKGHLPVEYLVAGGGDDTL